MLLVRIRKTAKPASLLDLILHHSVRRCRSQIRYQPLLFAGFVVPFSDYFREIKTVINRNELSHLVCRRQQRDQMVKRFHVRNTCSHFPLGMKVWKNLTESFCVMSNAGRKAWQTRLKTKVYVEGSRPERCISSMICKLSRDTPFWSGTPEFSRDTPFWSGTLCCGFPTRTVYLKHT